MGEVKYHTSAWFAIAIFCLPKAIIFGATQVLVSAQPYSMAWEALSLSRIWAYFHLWWVYCKGKKTRLNHSALKPLTYIWKSIQHELLHLGFHLSYWCIFFVYPSKIIIFHIIFLIFPYSSIFYSSSLSK